MTEPHHLERQARDRRLTRWAAWGLALLLPTTFTGGLVALSTHSAARCVEYGECDHAVPTELFPGCFLTAFIAGLVAAAWPRGRRTGGRSCAVALQWGATAQLALLLLTYGR